MWTVMLREAAAPGSPLEPMHLAIRRPQRRWLTLALALTAGCGDNGGVSVAAGRLDVPATVDFGDVQVGIRMPLTLELSNVGDGLVRIEDIAADAPLVNGAYTFTLDERSFVLAPGQSRDLQISFQPFAVQTASVALTIVTDAEGGNRPVVLRGEGVRFGLDVVPDPIDFGDVLSGTSRTVTAQVVNRLSTPVDVSTALDDVGRALIARQSGQGRFELLSPEPDARGALTPLGAPLGPGESFDVQIRYIPDPSALGVTDRALWSLSNCDLSLCERRVTMLGEGTANALRCQPDPIDFGSVPVGATSTLTVTCENIVNAPVTLSGWALSGVGAEEFQVPPFDRAGESLGPGERFMVPVTMVPRAVNQGRVVSGTFSVESRNAIGALLPAQVTVTGFVGGPDIEVAPQVLAFGEAALGTTKVRRVRIENAGSDPLTVREIAVDDSRFSVDRDALTLDPGAAALLEVGFTPTASAAVASGRLTVVSDDVDEGLVQIDLSGRGVSAPECAYSVTPTRVEFGIVQVLRSTGQGVRVQNVGTTDCLLNDLRIEPGAPFFGLDASTSTTSVVLEPGRSLTTVVTYTPQTSGVHEGTFAFYVASPAAPNPTVPLTGVGADAALLVSPNEFDFGTVSIGCSSPLQTVTIFNPGLAVTSIDRIERPPGVTSEFVLAGLPAGLPGRAVIPGEPITFSVAYTAAQEGQDTGVVHVYETGRSDPYVVSLLGAGADDPVNVERFTQLETPQVDVLFIIDNSGSMSAEQAALTENFRSFIQFAETQLLDYQIGVVSTEAKNCPRPGTADRPPLFEQGQCGYLADGNAAESDPTWRLIRPDTLPSPQTAFAVVAAQGIDGSGEELGLEAAYRALNPPVSTGWNAGFLRPDAYLALVFVSDEDDQSNDSVDFYVNFFRSIKGFRNQDLLSISAIVGDEEGTCGINADPGFRYIEAANTTGGIVEPICTADWAASLENLGQSVFGFRRRFLLRNRPAAGTLEVSVDGEALPDTGPNGAIWTYDPIGNALQFSPLATPEPGSEIVVTYRANCP